MTESHWRIGVLEAGEQCGLAKIPLCTDYRRAGFEGLAHFVSIEKSKPLQALLQHRRPILPRL
jgi:hypothetical protein